MIPRLRLDEFARPGEAYHFARVNLPAMPAKDVHRQDFHEIFWVEAGQGVHLINGHPRDLYPGLCLCVQPDDAHSVRSKPGHALRIVNIAFPSRTWLSLRKRYFQESPDFFHGPIGDRETDLTPWLSTELLTAAEDLATGPRTSLKIERFLINFFYRLATRSIPEESPQLPDWLEHACREIRVKKAFAGGVPAFARLAGRSSEHLARQVRRHLHKTPTDIVNEARLAHAATELQSSGHSIAEIALDCGVENLSHFYNLFRRHFGCTPRQYRLRNQRIVQ